jgi:hypothetical protein
MSWLHDARKCSGRMISTCSCVAVSGTGVVLRLVFVARGTRLTTREESQEEEPVSWLHVEGWVK